MKLTREDIQAIAQEINKQSREDVSGRVYKNKGARVESAIIEKPERKAFNHAKAREYVATIGLFVIWVLVFCVVLHKIAPYI